MLLLSKGVKPIQPGCFYEHPSTGQMGLRAPVEHPSHRREATRGLGRDVRGEEGDLC